MRTITLFSPEVKRREVTFRWQVDPPTTLYSHPHFTMRFPESVDLSRVPEGLWWTVMLICLHSQWPLLRPCRVRLPVRLRPGEAECWTRLMDAEVATLEAYRGTTDFERKIEVVEDGSPIDYPGPPTGATDATNATNATNATIATIATIAKRCATAFSGGKDSLVQTGLLTELTEKPALVATTSPMPPSESNTPPGRHQTLRGLRPRHDRTLMEAESTVGSNLNHGSP